MPVRVTSIETAVPPTVLRQSELRDVFAAQDGLSRLGQRLVRGAFDASAIDTRHTVLDELGRAAAGAPVPDAEQPPTFYDASTGTILDPLTGTRNDAYAEHSPSLFLDAAQRALDSAPGVSAGDVTHVVTASCTGFYAPGPDYAIVRGLGLDPTTERYHLGFMGCYAAFPALRTAAAFCTADPDAVVLVVCIELCSLHISSSDDPDVITAASVFADGAAAAVVTARPVPDGHTVLDLDAFHSDLTPTGEDDMAWTIGDHGFEMVLSRYVPKIIGEHIHGALAPLVDAAGIPGASDITHWAVHPGGRSILDKVQTHLELDDAQMAPSRATLREHGNMSSATVLFILRRILDASGDTPERVCALAFGPGLTVESALLTRRTV
ncbi:type III polyketide synthase [Sanguibacter suaedae]|uniref:Type III polyketide synthase n=1 Tax=Sanguibacter suaedae TaxID=2795737 RepID=A0A934M863_9MICO|nr:type III polyketide synthase [Sanguibacter suaedae]MBI9116187.1 type III polyketide synthase [Sanguibacter suaedae]